MLNDKRKIECPRDFIFMFRKILHRLHLGKHCPWSESTYFGSNEAGKLNRWELSNNAINYHADQLISSRPKLPKVWNWIYYLVVVPEVQGWRAGYLLTYPLGTPTSPQLQSWTSDRSQISR